MLRLPRHHALKKEDAHYDAILPLLLYLIDARHDR
jgi:hypothetical protein